MPSIELSSPRVWTAASANSSSRIVIVEAKPGPQRRQLVEEFLSGVAEQDASTWNVSCDFDRGGPWAGVNAFFRSFIDKLLAERRDLAEHHALELIHLLPELQRVLQVPHASLTDTAPPHERVRNYAADRALRIVHGLIDLLQSWKGSTAPQEGWFIGCDDYDRAGAIGRSFFRELMRRGGETLKLRLLVAVDAGESEAVRSWFEGEPEILSVAEEHMPQSKAFSETLDEETARDLSLALEQQIGDDGVAKEVHVCEMIRLCKAAHRKERLLYWKQFATEYFTRLGLYDDVARYTEDLLSLANAAAPEDEIRHLWVVNKTLTGYMGTADGTAGLAFAHKYVLPLLENPHSSEHINLFFLVAMMYARYSKPRNLAKGEEYLEQGLAALNRLANNSLHHFQYVFNRNGLAMIRSFQGRFEEAIELCRAGRERLDTHLQSDQHRLHRSVLVYNMAQVYAAMGAYDEAIENFTTVIAIDPEFSEYHNERGNLYLRLGRLEEALADYHEAVRLSPPYSEVHTNIGQCYRRMGRYREAIVAYDRSLDLKPNEPLALMGRAKAWEETGEREKAIADYSAAIRQDARQWEAFASRGVLHYEGGDLRAALGDFDSAIQLAPEQVALFSNRSIVLSELGRSKEAVSDLERALRLNPNGESSSELRHRLETLTAAA